MFCSEVALFGIFSAYMKKLPSFRRRGINTAECSREHSKGPACLSRNQPLQPPPSSPCSSQGQSLSRVSENMHSPTDFGVQSFLMRHAGLRLSSGLSQSWLSVTTQNFLQMSPSQEALPEDNLHEAITLLCFIYDTYYRKLHYLFTSSCLTNCNKNLMSLRTLLGEMESYNDDLLTPGIRAFHIQPFST